MSDYAHFNACIGHTVTVFKEYAIPSHSLSKVQDWKLIVRVVSKLLVNDI